MLRRFALSLLFLFLIGLPSAWALSVPEKPEGYVSDYAGMISPPVRAQLETQLAQFERDTSNQIVVVTFPSLEGESLEDFSIRPAEKWKIGQKEKNNGIIFLIFKNDRKMRIEVGYGLEGALTDAQSGIILDQIVKPRFREGNFDQGIIDGVHNIILATKGEFKAADANQSDNAIILAIILIGCLIAFITDSIRYGMYRSSHKTYKKRYSFLEWWFLFSILLLVLRAIVESKGSSGRSGGSSGGGGSSSGGGGGFSGGGGSFGGGGSSGGW